jgi:hypothetical protein
MSQPIGLIKYTDKEGLACYMEASEIQRIIGSQPTSTIWFKDGEHLSSLTSAIDIALDYDRLVRISQRPELADIITVGN